MIKLRISRQEDYLGLSRWISVITWDGGSLESERRYKTDVQNQRKGDTTTETELRLTSLLDKGHESRHEAASRI